MTAPNTPAFTAEDIVPRMVSEFGYSDETARLVASDLLQSGPDIRSAFWRWYQSGDLGSSPAVEGFTAESLVREKGLTPFAAFATLQDLRTDRRISTRSTTPSEAANSAKRSISSVTSVKPGTKT